MSCVLTNRRDRSVMPMFQVMTRTACIVAEMCPSRPTMVSASRSDDGLSVGRRLAMRPMPRRGREPGNPVHGPAARRTVQDEVSELSLEVGFHLEQLLAQHLRLECHRVGTVEARGDRLVDDGVGLGGLPAHGSDGPLEDVSLLAHQRRVAMRSASALAARWS